MMERAYRVFRPLAVAALLAVAMQAAHGAGALPPTVPAPTEIFQALTSDYRLLLENAFSTLQAAIAGFAAALFISLVLMTITALVRTLEPVIYNIALILHSLPLLVLAPILVVWFGLGLEARSIIAALAAYYAILIGGLNGLKAGHGRADELMHLLSASRTQVFWKVTFPYALPGLFAGIKIGATGAVLGAVIAEWTGAESGLGVLMSYSLFSFQVARVWLTMLAMMLLAIGVYALVQVIERRVLHWTPLGPSAT